jgi:site-specific DNA recombinase
MSLLMTFRERVASIIDNQKDLSLDDQVDHAKETVADLYDGAVEYQIVATKGKGEALDRPELTEIQAMLRSRELDLLVVDDLGRLVRGTAAKDLCGLAVDHGTRVIALNDCFDTADDTWEEDVISACRDHVGHNADTSKRIKQKSMNRFVKFGGSTPLPIFGYIKPEGAKTFDAWEKDPNAEPIFQEWARRLLASPNCTAVADWLNKENVPMGKFCRTKKWAGAVVRRISANPLLKGLPGRGFKHTVKNHETGRRISVKKPEGPRFRDCPHLAHWTPEVFDEINAVLQAANQGRGRKPINGADPRLRVPRKRTRFPGQHARCGYCGRQSVWGGNGMKDNLQCNGSREWRCWNSIGFNGGLATTRIVEAIWNELTRLEGFDEQFRTLVDQARRAGDVDQTRERSELVREEVDDTRRRQNLLDSIVEYGPKPMFQEKLVELEDRERDRARRRRQLDRLKESTPVLPDSVTDLRRLFETKAAKLAEDTPEFGDLLRLVVPDIDVYLVRLIDGGHLLPRARVRLTLGGLVPDANRAPGLNEFLTRELTLDLFEPPHSASRSAWRPRDLRHSDTSSVRSRGCCRRARPKPRSSTRWSSTA